MAYAVVINYGDGDKDLSSYGGVNLVRQDSFSRTETLYNADRKAVVNTARFSIDLDTTLANALLTLDFDQEITCTITKDSAAWFKGYIRPVTDFTIRTSANQIDFEAVDRLYFLQKKLGTTIAKVSTDSMVVSASGGGATSLVHALTSAISFPGTVYAADIDDEIDYYRADAGENGKTVFELLDELLFSYHHVFYADAAGDLRMHDWSPASITPAGTFNDANIIEELSVSRDDSDETGVAVTWYRTSSVKNKRVVSGSEYGAVWLAETGTNYYPPKYSGDDYLEKNWHWGLDEDSDTQVIGLVYASSRYLVAKYVNYPDYSGSPAWKRDETINAWVDAASNYLCPGDSGSQLSYGFTVDTATNSAATASSVFHGTGNGVQIGAFEVSADVVYKIKQGAVYYPATTTNKIKKIDGTWILTKTAADELASAAYDMITDACYKYRFRSAVAAGIGTYYTLANTDLNISTTVRITKRTTTQILGTEYYEYEAEGASEISTLTTETSLATIAAPATPAVIETPEVIIEIGELPSSDKEVWLRFEGNVNDSSGNSTNGTAYNTPTYTDNGRIGQAIVLNGSSQYVTLPYTIGDALMMEDGSAFTVACFFRFEDVRAGMALVSKDSDSFPLFRMGIGYTDFSLPYLNAGKYHLYLEGNDLSIASSSVYRFLQPGTWHHACVTWDETTATLYIDGEAVGTDATPAGYTDDENPVQIGRRIIGATDSLYFSGRIDELLIYQGALTSDEVYQLSRYGTIGLIANQIGPPAKPELIKLDSDRVIIDGELKTQYITGEAPLFGIRAWVNFDGGTSDNVSGTYARDGTTVTITYAAHGYSVGHVVYLNFTSGAATDGIFTIATVPSADTFTITHGSSGSTSGNVDMNRRDVRASGNVHSVSYLGTGYYAVNFITAMPDANYAASGAVNRESSAYAGIHTPAAMTASAYTFYVRDVSNNVKDGALQSVVIVR